MVTVLLLCALITGILIARGHPNPAVGGCAYILVLGCRVDGTKPGPILRYRIAKAGAYLKAHPETTAILSGGRGDEENISEAECMHRELMALGISDKRLWLEEKSTTTKENFSYSLEIIREKTGGIPEHIGILSSETHLYRSSLYAKRLGLQSLGIPAKTDSLFYRMVYFLREIPCIWNYYLFGG